MTTDVYLSPITYLDNDIYLAIVQLSQSGDSQLVQNDLIGEHLGRDPASITVNNESWSSNHSGERLQVWIPVRYTPVIHL